MPTSSHASSNGVIAASCLAYIALLVSLSGRLSLWLDEVLQLEGTRGQSISEIVRYLTWNPGSTPLGYLTQAAFVNGFGYSLVSARISSIVCSALACVAVWVLGRDLLSRRGAVLSFVVFMFLPLQFRYAIEARPYSQALMFSVLSTVLLLRLLDGPSRARGFAYCAVVSLGLFSHPFSIFVPIGHVLWSIRCARRSAEWVRVRNVSAIAVAGACLLFLPWFLYAGSGWKASIARMPLQPQGFHALVRAPLMILREISGAGYLGGSLLLIISCLGLRSHQIERSKRVLLGFTVLVPVVGALIADSFFGYFLAIRQVIFSLPGAVLLACEGYCYLCRMSRNVGLLLVAALLAVSIWCDIAWFRRPREDWRSASKALSAAARTACIVPAPMDDPLKLYRFFDPELPNHLCATSPRQSQAVLALSPYRSSQDEADAYRWLAASGFHRKVRETTAGSVKILWFER